MSNAQEMDRMLIIWATRGVLCLSCAFSFSGTTAQIPVPCSNASELQDRTNRICAELLPEMYRVWYVEPDGDPCYCPCNVLLRKSAVQIEELRSERSEKFERLVGSFKEKNADRTLHGAHGAASLGSAPGMVLSDDFEFVGIPGEYPCRKDAFLHEQVIPRLQRSPLLAAFGDDVHINYASGLSDTNARYYFPMVTGDGSIILPSTFVRKCQVQEALLVFMIMHEFGHIRASDIEAPGMDVSDEVAADAWAAEIGMRGYFNTGESYAAAIREFSAQLEDYINVIHPRGAFDQVTVENAFDCEAEDDRYPEDYPRASCRVRLAQCLSSSVSCSDGTGHPSGGYGDAASFEALRAALHDLLCSWNCWETNGEEREDIGMAYTGGSCDNSFCMAYGVHLNLGMDILRSDTGRIGPPISSSALERTFPLLNDQLAQFELELRDLCRQFPYLCMPPGPGTAVSEDPEVIRQQELLQQLLHTMERSRSINRRLQELIFQFEAAGSQSWD